MREFIGGEFEGITIVDFGISFNVYNGEASVHYEDAAAEYSWALENGAVVQAGCLIKLSKEQLSWLVRQQAWVDEQIENGE